MPKPRPLTPFEAQNSLAHRLGPRGDRLRQLATRFGIRSRRVFLVWRRWTGEIRGSGSVAETIRQELLPTPKVADLSGIQMSPFDAGVLQVGSVRVSRISSQLAEDTLLGKRAPATEGAVDGRSITKQWEFWWELQEDGRGNTDVSQEQPDRQRFRVVGHPTRREGNVEWVVTLERVSEDDTPQGLPQHGLNKW